MEFTIEREVFLEGVKKTLGVIERKSTLPILGNILIAAAGEGITIVATDREISLTVAYPASVIVDGRFTIPARKIYEAVRELSGETLHLEGDGRVAVLTSNKTVCRLYGLPADDFPRVADPDELSCFKIKAVLLRDLIGKVHFAISDDDHRKALQGVFVETEPDSSGNDTTIRIRMVATDGHRMALIMTAITPGVRLVHNIIIPRKGLQEIRKLLEDEAGDVEIGIMEGTCIVKNEKGASLSVSLIDGEFPDYRRVIPEQGDDDIVIRIDKSALLHGLRRMGVIEPGRVDIILAERNDKPMIRNILLLDSVNPDIGEIHDEIEVHQCNGGANRTAAFSGKYLIDAVESISGETVEFRFPKARDMVVIRDAENENHFCIVMGLKF